MGIEALKSAASGRRRAPSLPDLLSMAGLGLLVALVTLSFYNSLYSVHPDVAGGALSGRLALTLGTEYDSYSIYFPPIERLWFSFAAALSDVSGLRLDLVVVVMTTIAVTISASLAYAIRRQTTGASPLFLFGSTMVLVVVPVTFMNAYAMREHIVVLGLWPFLVLRVSDPQAEIIGWKTRVCLGAWLGVTLLFKYLYSVVVLLVEIADAAIGRRPAALFRIENVISGFVVASYLFVWLGLDPAQRKAIATMASGIEANLTGPLENFANAAANLGIAAILLLLARLTGSSLRTSAIGLALVLGGLIAAWIQLRWYAHHVFPVTMAYIAWLWMVRRALRSAWIVGLAVLTAMPVVAALWQNNFYQETVKEIDAALADAGLSVEGTRVGVLNMNPSPMNQFLASHGAWRWNSTVNNAYVAAELKDFDRPENANRTAPPVRLNDPGRRMLHDEMLRLWEDMPPDAIILDHSRSWPLRHVEVRWKDVFAEERRFGTIMQQYRPVFTYQGRLLEFTYFERIAQK